MDDWETVIKPVKIVDTWEDEGNDVPDAWDADEDPKEETKVKPQTTTTTKKLTAKEKMAQKEAKKQKVIEEMLEKQKEAETRHLTEREREELAKEQEAKLIQDSFGIIDTPVQRDDGLDFDKVSTKQDFNDLSDKLVAKFKKLEISPHYSAFAENFIRQISLQMDLDNLKELSTSLGALMNEKQKLTKNKKKKVGPKTKIIMERDKDVVNHDKYDDVVDDFDDFL